MKKIVLLTLVCISAIFVTACKADSSQKDSNATQPQIEVATQPQPENEIWYTSKDGTIVEPQEVLKRYISNVFGANLVSNTYQDGKGVIVFDDVVKYIGPAFKDNCNLTSISIPEGVTKIAQSSFYNCTSLSSVTIPRGVTEIGDRAFCNCTSLTSIIIPNSVIHIGDRAFAFCTSLTSIAIPYPSSYSTTSLGEKAFAYCKSLTSIYCKSSNPPSLYGGNAFEGVSSDCNLYVPTKSVEIYKKTTGWRRFYSTTIGYDFPQEYYDKATNRIRGYND